MKTVNIHEAKTHLSRLIEEAVHGEGFIIAKAGQPMVQVTAIADPDRPARALGWMRGQFTVPDDFITMDAAEIQAMFEGEE